MPGKDGYRGRGGGRGESGGDFGRQNNRGRGRGRGRGKGRGLGFIGLADLDELSFPRTFCRVPSSAREHGNERHHKGE